MRLVSLLQSSLPAALLLVAAGSAGTAGTAAVAAQAAPASPQTSQPPQTPQTPQEVEATPTGEVFIESIDVSVVNVDVVVTDRAGRRVTGLSRADFELREDGKPVEITNFYAVAGDAPAPSQPAPEMALLPGAASEANAANAVEAVPEEQRLYLTLYLDNRGLTPQVRKHMVPALERFVSTRLRPDDRLMIATYDGTLKIRQTPTNDVAALKTALAAATKSVPRGIETANERRRILHELAKGEEVDQGQSEEATRPLQQAGLKQEHSEDAAYELYGNIQVYANAQYRQTRATLENLGQLVDSLSGLPGRKVLLYVGGGLSLRPTETLVRAYLDKYAFWADKVGAGTFDAFDQDTTRMFNQIVERANAQRVTFYTLGASTVDSRLTAEWGENRTFTQDLEAIERYNNAAPFEIMAGGTGGLGAFDVSDPGVLLERMREDLGTYYSLGYVPHNRADGKSHKIEVVPRDRSLKVRHREGFRAQTTAERAASRTLAAMVLGVAQNPLDVNLGVEEETLDQRGRPVLSVLVMFPMSKLVLLPLKHVHQGRIRIFVGTRDQEGKNSTVSQIPVPVQVPNDQLLTALGKTAAFRIRVAVKPGEQTIAVSVRDELGNADATALANYTAGSKVAKTAASEGTGTQ